MGRKTEKKGPLPVIAMGVMTVIGIIVLQQAFLLLVVGMMPSIVIYITDREPQMPLFKTVLAFNFAGVFYFLMKLLNQSPIDSSTVMVVLQDSMTWFSILVTASTGYVVYYIAPYVAFAILRMFTEGNLIRLRSSQQRLLNDWGPDIKNSEQ